MGCGAEGYYLLRTVVSNTGPLLHLIEAQSLELLKLVGQVHIPKAVVREVSRHQPTWSIPNWIKISPLSESNVAEAEAWQQASLLDLGEAEALALARQLSADWFLTDDTAARFLAQKLNLEVHGSLGVVLWAAAVGHLDRGEAEASLARLSASSLWLSARVLSEAQKALAKLFET